MITKPRYFELTEFIDSSTARQKSIQNAPTWEVVEHLLELCRFLDDLREAWSRTPAGKGTGLRVSSGYRCPALNTAVGGVKNSAHMRGDAADLVPSNGKIDEFIKFLKNWLPKYERGFDQCIVESKKGSRWVHFSNYGAGGGQRRQLFDLVVK